LGRELGRFNHERRELAAATRDARVVALWAHVKARFRVAQRRPGREPKARITQIMNLLLLAPEIQERLLFLPRVERGPDPVYLKDLQVVAREVR
jgi:hypothetical protein